MTVPHLRARVHHRDADLVARLRGQVSYPTDIAGAITAAMEARFDVLRDELHLPTSDDRAEAAAEAKRTEPIRRAVLAFQADAAASIRAAGVMRPDILTILNTLAKMIEGFPVEEYVSGERGS